MSKRFLDTGFLEQRWIRKLTPEKKIFLIYLMLKCDNGGIIDLDSEDIEFWIGQPINNFEFLPENYLIPLNHSGRYFIPKFIEWQYPNFPHSKVHQQEQAKQILIKNGIFDINNQVFMLPKTYLKLTQTLPESQANGNANVNGNVKGESEGEVNNPSDRRERNKKYLPLAEYLSKIIQSNKNIKHTPKQISLWTNYIRQLEENDGVNYDRIKNALLWYEKHIGEEYVVEIESGNSLREKFIRLETASKKTNSFRRETIPEKIIRDGEEWFLQSDGKYRNTDGNLYRS